MSSRLQTINASASPEVQMNENFDAVAPNALFARKSTATAGLTWGYYGGIFPQTYANIPDGTLTLADNATNYIECDDVGALHQNTSAFTVGSVGSPPSPRWPLYSVVAAAGVVTAYTDFRTTLGINTLAGPAGPTGPAGSGSGDVVGPSGATDAAIVLFDGTTGTLIKDSAVLLAALAQLGLVQSWTKAQRGAAPAGLTSTSGATAIDLDTGNNFTMAMTENSTLSAPSHPVQGQSGCIVVTQDPATPRTLAYNAFWKFPGGTVPTLTARAGAVDVFTYYIESGTRATCSLLGDVK